MTGIILFAALDRTQMAIARGSALAAIAVGAALILLGVWLLYKAGSHQAAAGASSWVDIGGKSDIGNRASQQDSFSIQPLMRPTGEEFIELGMVCDGMGGLSGGEQASEECVRTVFTRYYNYIINGSQADPRLLLREAIVAADQVVSNLPGPNGAPLGAGTTIVAAAARDGKVYWASAGDSRIYLYREGVLRQLTTDHNLLLALRSMGVPEEEIRKERRPDALTNFVGRGENIRVDTGVEDLDPQAGDVLILCSDGLYKALSAQDIKAVVESGPLPAKMLAETLVERALSRKDMRHDNITVVVFNGGK